MAVAHPIRSRYAAAWAVLLGSLLILAGSIFVVAVGPAQIDVLLGLWFGITAFQLAVFTVLVAIGYRDQRTYWSTAIPVSVVIAQTVAALCAVLVDGAAVDTNAKAPYADILF